MAFWRAFGDLVPGYGTKTRRNTSTHFGKMTGASIYFDTAPFIYLLEGHPEYTGRVEQVIRRSVADGLAFHTSVLAIMEFEVKPLQLNRIDIIQAFEALLRDLNFVVQPVTREIARQAATMRAALPAIKGLDALHLSTAMNGQCQTFLTNDKQLTQIPGINALVLSQVP